MLRKIMITKTRFEKSETYHRHSKALSFVRRNFLKKYHCIIFHQPIDSSRFLITDFVRCENVTIQIKILNKHLGILNQIC